jgi:hypothetical protein
MAAVGSAGVGVPMGTLAEGEAQDASSKDNSSTLLS